MISISSPIWGYKKTTTPPTPFDNTRYHNKKQQVTLPDGKIVISTMCNGIIKAMIIMAALQEEAAGKTVEFTTLHEGVAIGTRSNSENGETVYVEKSSKTRECTDIIKYNPESGDIQGVFYPEDGARYSPYKLEGKGSTDGTAIFLSLFDILVRENYHINSEYQEIKNMFTEATFDLKDPVYDDDTYEFLDKLWSKMGIINYLVYKELTTDNSRIKCTLNNETELPTIASTSIKRGNEGPSKGKVTYGKFKILKEGGKASKAQQKKANKEMLKKAAFLPFERNEKDFSDEELAMIPQVKKSHVISDEEVFIISEIMNTFEDDLNSIKTIMLLGQSSSGKSHLAETIAARMHRPYSAPLTCTPNMDETTLLGTTLPVIEGGKTRDGLSKDDNDLLDKLYSSKNENEAKAAFYCSMGVPEPEVVLYDPETAYQKITGKFKDSVEPYEVMTLIQQKVSSKLRELVTQLPKNEGVSYMYYKSPLVKAIENGWMIEIQEFNVVKEAALFTSLNNVFDKDSNGILETPYGQVLRHPDFRAIYTANPNYAGCRDPHQSVIARSDMIVTMNNPAESVMRKRIESRMKFEDKDLLKQVIHTFTTVSNRAVEISCNGEATMRELYRFANAINRNVDKELALENYLLNAITRDEEDKAELREAAYLTDLYVF